MNMAFPNHTRTGKNWQKRFLEMSLEEIEKECKHNLDIAPDWLPMFRELADYIFTLEERITKLEHNEM